MWEGASRQDEEKQRHDVPGKTGSAEDAEVPGVSAATGAGPTGGGLCSACPVVKMERSCSPHR